jgi:GTPase SAR1 family protein
MEDGLRDKFKYGCDYNMKIIVRGARRTGKTSLLNRLQGLQMPNSYIPTPEIRIGTINWTGSSLTADHVKVEAWEVVDHGIMKEDASLSADTLAGLSPRARKSKTSNWDRTKKQRGAQTVGALDASMVDVYKGTDGVIFMVDVRDKKTFQYAAMLLDGVPVHIPTVVIGNFADCSDLERQVTVDDLASLVTTPPKKMKSPIADPVVEKMKQAEKIQKAAPQQGEKGVQRRSSILSTPPSTPPSSDDEATAADDGNDAESMELHASQHASVSVDPSAATDAGAEGTTTVAADADVEAEEARVVAIAEASAAIAVAVENGQLPQAELLQPSSNSSSRSVSGGKVSRLQVQRLNQIYAQYCLLSATFYTWILTTRCAVPR